MSKKIFIDTNVLVDIVTARKQPHVIYSQELFAAGITGEVELYVSALSFVTVVYVAKKYKMREDAVKATLKALLKFMQLVDLSAQNVISMLDSTWPDYEDATQHLSALSIKADIIATGNIRDFQDSTLRVMTPQQILEEL